MEILKSITELSDAGLLNILSSCETVFLDGEESRTELEQILQMNINADIIDEIEVIIELSGE